MPSSTSYIFYKTFQSANDIFISKLFLKTIKNIFSIILLLIGHYILFIIIDIYDLCLSHNSTFTIAFQQKAFILTQQKRTFVRLCQFHILICFLWSFRNKFRETHELFHHLQEPDPLHILCCCCKHSLLLYNLILSCLWPPFFLWAFCITNSMCGLQINMHSIYIYIFIILILIPISNLHQAYHN